MKKKLYFLLIRIKNFWSDFAPCIVDFTIIGLLGFWIYWTRWRK